MAELLSYLAALVVGGLITMAIAKWIIERWW